MASEAQLLAMGLTPQDVDNDETLMNAAGWQRKREFLAAVIKSDMCKNKPSGDEFFSTTKPTVPGAAKCNIMVPIVKLTAVVVEGNEDGSNKAIPEEVILAKKEGAEWSLQNLTWSNGETKESKHMNVASNPNTYAIPEYFDYVPIQVRNSATAFK